MLQAERWRAGSRPDEVNEFFQFNLILPTALGPGVNSASDINEYQKQKNNVPDNVGSLTFHNHIVPHGLLRESFAFL
jgi:hypothetical protein